MASLPLSFSGLGLPSSSCRAAASRLVGITSNASYGQTVPALSDMKWTKEHAEASKLRKLLLRQAPGIDEQTMQNGEVAYNVLPTEEQLHACLVDTTGGLPQISIRIWMRQIMTYIYKSIYKLKLEVAEPEMKIVMEQGRCDRSLRNQFLKVLPFSDNTTLNPLEFKSAIKRVLGLDIYDNDPNCTLCDRPTGTKRGHDLRCRAIEGIKRHDYFVSTIAYAFRLVSPVCMEIQTSNSSNRRMDIRMDDNGTITWCDVSITSEFQKPGIVSATKNERYPHKKVLDIRHRQKLKKYEDDAKMQALMGLRKVKMEPLIFTCGGAVHDKTMQFLLSMREKARARGDPTWLFDLFNNLSFGLHRTSYAMECKAKYKRDEKRLNATPVS